MNPLQSMFGAALLMLVFSAVAQDIRTMMSDREMFVISYQPALEPISINQIHNWVVHVETVDGDAVEAGP